MNKIRRFMLLTFALIAGATLVGCDDDGSKKEEVTDDVNNPTITMDNLDMFAGLSGAVDIEVTAEDQEGVATVELLVNGEVVATATEAPYTLSWDTTATDDGLVEVAAKVTDTGDNTAETEVVQAVVINDGEVVTLDEGSTGEIVIPDPWDETMETHVKHHWTSSADGYSHVLVVFINEPEEGQADWDITLDFGTGFCPHSGQALDQSPIDADNPKIYDSAPSGGFPGSTMLFVHAGANAEDHVGESLPYEMLVFAFF